MAEAVIAGDLARTLEALHAALDADPGDRVARAALADALEEAGDEKAAAFQRWLLANGKHPYRSRGNAPYGQSPGWWWFSDTSKSRYPEYDHSLIGKWATQLWGQVNGPHGKIVQVGNWFCGRREAEERLQRLMIEEGLLC